MARFGLIAGLGLLTKLTMLYFGLAVFVALLITPARRQLLSPGPGSAARWLCSSCSPTSPGRFARCRHRVLANYGAR